MRLWARLHLYLSVGQSVLRLEYEEAGGEEVITCFHAINSDVLPLLLVSLANNRRKIATCFRLGGFGRHDVKLPHLTRNLWSGANWQCPKC